MDAEEEEAESEAGTVIVAVPVGLLALLGGGVTMALAESVVAELNEDTELSDVELAVELAAEVEEVSLTDMLVAIDELVELRETVNYSNRYKERKGGLHGSRGGGSAQERQRETSPGGLLD